jgi:TonB family protein
MHELNANPVNCPDNLSIVAIPSVLFCGKIPKDKRGTDTGLQQRIDSMLFQSSGARKCSDALEWKRSQKYIKRTYVIDSIPVDILINSKKGLVVFRYQKQCLSLELPQPANPSEVFKLPKLIEESKTKLEYPELARKAKIEANVIVQVIVNKDGIVKDTCILQAPSEKLGFNTAAAEAVQSWRFIPASIEGIPVTGLYIVRVDFDLK